MSINMKNWAREYIESSEKKAMPILSFPGIQLTGHTVEEMVKDGHLQALGYDQGIPAVGACAFAAVLETLLGEFQPWVKFSSFLRFHLLDHGGSDRCGIRCDQPGADDGLPDESRYTEVGIRKGYHLLGRRL